VEEKRSSVKESIHYSVADAVEDDAVAADQDPTQPTAELTEIPLIPFGDSGARFASFAHYMRHLNDREQHNLLKRDISDHLWRSSQLQKAKIHLQRLQQVSFDD
jgi:hypothetical protein